MNIDELLELFLDTVPSCRFYLDITSSFTEDRQAIRIINTSRLNIRCKVLVRRRAALFHYANRSTCSMMFNGEEIILGPRVAARQATCHCHRLRQAPRRPDHQEVNNNG